MAPRYDRRITNGYVISGKSCLRQRFVEEPSMGINFATNMLLN
jgi:hypothetical protein